MQFEVSALRSHLGLLILLVVFSACRAPQQMGGVVVAPGAEDRLRLLVRYGHGVEGVAPAAQVRVAAREEQIPGGDARTGRVGDWVLDNGIIVAVVARVDTTPRSGHLVDLVRGWEGRDDLHWLETRVLGQPIQYEVASSGRDATLGSAYVVVSGHVDLSRSGGPVLAVETRYDVAPKLDVLLVSTRIQVEVEGVHQSPSLEEPAAEEVVRVPTMEDRLRVRNATFRADQGIPQVSALGPASGYTLQPLSDGTPSPSLRGIAYGDGVLTEKGDWVLYSRALVSLERPDTLSAEVAGARVLGEPTQALEIRVIPKSGAPRSVGRGDFALDRPGKARLTAEGIVPCGAEGLYRFSAPLGTYLVAFRGGLHVSSGPVSIEVQPGAATRVELSGARASAPYVTEFSSRCPPSSWPDDMR